MGKQGGDNYKEFNADPQIATTGGADDWKKFDGPAQSGSDILAAHESHSGFEGDSQYDSGLNPYSNQNELRSKNQPWYDQLGNSLAKVIPGAALSVVENAGDLGELLFDWDDDKEYSNAFTEFAQKGKEALNEEFHTYQATPGNELPSLSAKDSGWWFNLGDGLVQSMAAFYATGAGVGDALGKGAKALAGLMNGAKGAETALKIGQGAAQLATASSLAYTEGIQSAAQVYSATRKQASIEHPEWDEAKIKEVASDAASKTMWTNTIINTGLNITGLSPLFKSYGNLDAGVKSQLSRGVKETIPQYIARLGELEKTIPKQASVLRLLASEAVQEGVEEDVNIFAENEGYRQGGVKSMVKSDKDSAIDRFLDVMFSEEGAINFFSGAVGGIGQTAGLEYAPLRSYTAEDGTKRRTSAHNLEQIEKADYQAEVITALKTDMQSVQDNQKALNEAVVKGDRHAIEVARGNLFNVAVLKAARNESTDELANEVSKMGQVDNTVLDANGTTEAMRQGLADDTNDHRYRETAAKRATDIKTLNQAYRDLGTVFSHPHVHDEAFRARLNIYNAQSVVEDMSRNAAHKETQLASLVTDPEVFSGLRTEAQIAAYDYALDYLAKDPSSTSSVVSQEANRITKLRDELKQVHSLLTQGNPELSSKIKANLPLVKANDLLSDYTYKAVAEQRLISHKEAFSGILSDLKKFQRDTYRKVKETKDRITKEKTNKTKVEETTKEAADATAASEYKKDVDTTAATQPDIDKFALDIANGKPTNSPEQQQFYENNKDRVEQALQKIKVTQDVKGTKVTKKDVEEVNKELDPRKNIVATEQVAAVSLPVDEIYTGKAEVDITEEQYSLEQTLEDNTLNPNKINGKQNKIAHLSQDYTEDKSGNKVTDNPLVVNLRYGFIQSPSFGIGATVTLSVAKEYRNGAEEEDSVPIEIRYEGKIAGYVHKYVKKHAFDDEGNDPYDLLLLRRYVIANGEVTTKITAKDIGVLNTTKDGDQVLVKEAFHTTPTFAIGKKEGAYIDKDTPYANPLVNGKALKAGYLYAIVPTPNGKEMALPLDITKVRGDIADSIGNALHIFLKQDSLEKEQIELVHEVAEKYGMNLLTGEGLRAYVNTFIVTTDLEDKATLDRINESTKDASYIKVTANGIKYTKNKGLSKTKDGKSYFAPEIGKYSPQNLQDELIEEMVGYVKNVYARVDLGRIKNNYEFSAPIFHINQDGTLGYSDLHYATYAEYIADNSRTNVLATKTVGNEQSVFVQPAVYFDNSFLLGKPENSSEKAILATELDTTTPAAATPKKKGFKSSTKVLPGSHIAPENLTKEDIEKRKDNCT